MIVVTTILKRSRTPLKQQEHFHVSVSVYETHISRAASLSKQQITRSMCCSSRLLCIYSMITIQCFVRAHREFRCHRYCHVHVYVFLHEVMMSFPGSFISSVSH